MANYNDGYVRYLPGPDNNPREFSTVNVPGRDEVDPPRTTKEVRMPLDPERLLITFGTLVLLVICAVPIANAAALLDDFNYVFWLGSEIPLWLITLSALVIILYMITGLLFFKYTKRASRSEQTIVMIAHTFITMLGLIFMMIALSLVSSTTDTYNNLHRRCQFSEETHKVFEYSQLLHTLRRQPGCKEKYSVEECDGYQDAPPYTTFLKNLEDNFRCSGFCYLPPGQLMDTNPALLSQSISLHERGRARNTPSSASQQDKNLDIDRSNTIPTSSAEQDTSLSVNNSSAQTENATAGTIEDAVVDLDRNQPPALFSDSNFQISCDGTAARDVRDFAGDIGHQLWYQGLYLVSIAIGTGFLKLMGFCATSFKISAHSYAQAIRSAYANAKQVDF